MFDPIPVPALCPTLAIGGSPMRFSMPGGMTPLILAVDIPQAGWLNWLVGKRYTVKVATSFPSNTGVYGPNKGEATLPIIDGAHGVVTGPGQQQYGVSYTIVRELRYGFRNYIVVRPQSPGVASGQVTISIA